MCGLRDRKKEESRCLIVGTAAHLFAENGFDDTTMEDIAARADVSVGTLYNYFGSKTALLLSAVGEDTDDMIEQGAAILAKPGRDPLEACKRLFGSYIDSLGKWDRELLREVMAVSFRRGGAELTTELAQMDMRLIAQIITLLEPFRQSGAIRSDVAVEDAGMLLYSTLLAQLFIYISLDGISIPALKMQLNCQIELTFRGLAPVNEKANRE